jgi:GH15 family glucan-1,4-alpha-glucosidase
MMLEAFMYKRISDYGIVGNLHTVALVSLEGSIDWMCTPFLDSPSVFASLLDHERGGRFAITPDGEFDSAAEYTPGTNVLVTSFRKRGGVVRLTDFMPVPEKDTTGLSVLFRIVQCTEGSMHMRMLFEPRLDYARARTAVHSIPGGATASGFGEGVKLLSELPLDVRENGAYSGWEIKAGKRMVFRLSYGSDKGPAELDVEQARERLERTERYWKLWLARKETGRDSDPGPHREMVDRSALLLKLLQYRPTGAMAAAATTSLPEEVGGERNWDYRYTWVRDTSFTLQALFSLGHLKETEDYLRWVEKLFGHCDCGAESLKIMYGLRGEDDIAEEELPHLEGYKGSRPVRIGNAAAGQRQMDIYGELMDSALRLADYVGKIDQDSWGFLDGICDYVAGHWGEPDSGIWEVRGGPWHFVYSKVMCWVALDRGLKIAARYGFPADTGRWEREKERIRDEVIERGWDPHKHAFRQHYDTDALDASNLLIPVLGFLPPDDARVQANLEATERELAREGFLYRYLTDDGLSGGEGAFLLCSLWYADNLVQQGRLEEAEATLRKVEGVANHLGLFSEQYDIKWREQLGNFPQAFTHIGYINSVMALRRARPEKDSMGAKASVATRKPADSWSVLNDGPSYLRLPPVEMATRLKNTMNVLRGAFFDSERGRVAYERMKGSSAYREYLELSYALRGMDLMELSSWEEKVSFWINLYNVLVIHGVVELGIRDSVKESGGFFRRIRYRIGGEEFSPDDIEHGILRMNSRPPWSLMRPFKSGDTRIGHIPDRFEPRVHFALVCASSSCPPIGVYTAEGLEEELTVAAKTFLNSGGMVLDRKRRSLSLSRIFRWYGRDLGKTIEDRLRFAARFLYNEEDRAYVDKNASSLKISYQPYDWRLNRVS